MHDPELCRAMILGLIQGLTEFLPVSSTGHLVVFGQLLNHWLGVHTTEEHDVMLDVALHVGTLGAIFIVFRKELWSLPSRPRLCLLIILACIPAGLVGVLLKEQLKSMFQSPLVVAYGWITTAVLLWIAQHYSRDCRDLQTMTVWDALMVGLFQAVRVPGISRSGSTIAGGLLSGMTRESAATFSFLIAVPVIAGAALVEARHPLLQALRGQTIDAPPMIPLLVGTFIAFIVGWGSLVVLLKAITRRCLHWFSIYCLLAAATVFVWHFTGGQGK